MKAFLLSAGKGTRLRPITYYIPKCLIPINNRPLLDYWFELLERHDIRDILINTSHLSEKIREYVEIQKRDLNIRLTYEETLLGSGGTIKKNWDFVEDVECFYIIYSDNLTNINLTKMFEFHKSRRTNFTLALIRVPNPHECGVVEIDRDLRIISFQEKPRNPSSDLAFAGIMLSNKKLKDYFPDKEVFDLGFDVLPNLVKSASGYIMDEYLLDIGTPEKLKKTQEDVKSGVFKF
jgi:mannose-1-phosphate guanylyltransferase